MSQFPPALDYVLNFEDAARSYANVPDVGGYAIAGINSKSWPASYAAILACEQSSRGPMVATFYQNSFWTPMKLGGLDSQDLANRVLDAGVNMGIGTAIKLMQNAANLLKPGLVEVDGANGPNTLAAVNSLEPEAILAAFRSLRLGHYQEIVDNDSSKAVYLGTAQKPGPWWRRAEA